MWGLIATMRSYTWLMPGPRPHLPTCLFLAARPCSDPPWGGVEGRPPLSPRGSGSAWLLDAGKRVSPLPETPQLIFNACVRTTHVRSVPPAGHFLTTCERGDLEPVHDLHFVTISLPLQSVGLSLLHSATFLKLMLCQM